MILMGKSARGQWGIAKTKIVYYTDSPYERSSFKFRLQPKHPLGQDLKVSHLL